MLTRITTTSTLSTPHSAFRTRSGMSMAEVLVALFLMALGSIAILTMFPLGMYHMGQALKDDRTAQSASQADAFMRMYWLMNVVENPNASNTAATGFPGYEPMVNALDFPDWKPDLGPLLTPTPPKNVPPGTLPNLIGQPVPSYPVFVDPMGYGTFWSSQNSAAQQFWIGNQFYARRNLNLLLDHPPPFTFQTQGPNASQRACSLMDGFGFNENGTPSTNGGAIERELRYNWLWVIQRPDNSNRNTASMTVVVFDKRAFQYAPQNAEAVFATQFPAQPFTVIVPGNVNFTAPGNADNTIIMQPLLTTIQVPVSRGIPPVQKGGWIMDATPGLRHAIFYRVVSVTDNPNNTMIANGVATVVPTTDLELQTPIRRLDGGTVAYPGTLIYMAGVSEVFERPNLTPNDY